MALLIWDDVGNRRYETGVQQAVLYIRDAAGTYPTGVAWNGITSVSESPEGADSNPLYADNIKYLNLISAEDFKATIEAYTYPTEFGVCDGSADLGVGVSIGQQTRKAFGLAFKTVLGNDTLGDAYAYKLHLIYNALAAPTEKAYSTINDSPEAISFSWELTTSPENVTGFKPTASITIDSSLADPTKLQALEDELFGTAIITANLPLPDAVATIFA